jgi:hypothetical protein
VPLLDTVVAPCYAHIFFMTIAIVIVITMMFTGIPTLYPGALEDLRSFQSGSHTLTLIPTTFFQRLVSES